MDSKIRECYVEGCDHAYYARGICNMHYQRLKKYGDVHKVLRTRDGKVKHRLYTTYQSMKNRCYIESSPNYGIYGGRGIKICDRWLGANGFRNFLEDMGEKPGEDYSIDRIDNNGNYEPENCRWATLHQQMSNRQNSREVVGVYPTKSGRRWYAQTTVNKVSHSKTFATFEEAVAHRKLQEAQYNLNPKESEE